jgi:hypothetical protein
MLPTMYRVQAVRAVVELLPEVLALTSSWARAMRIAEIQA